MFFLVTVILITTSCKSLNYAKTHQVLKPYFSKDQTSNYFKGLFVIDAATQDTLYNYNGHRYFIPASNTKIFTLYGALKLLPDVIPVATYVHQSDTLYIQGTGDPTFLHPYFKDSTLIHFSKGFKHLALHLDNFKDTAYGPGWAWEDYQYYYSPERSGLPIYGNVVTVSKKKDSIIMHPNYFSTNFKFGAYTKQRELYNNIFYFNPKSRDSTEIPFVTSTTTTKSLLENLLDREVHLVKDLPKKNRQLLKGISSDSVYKYMMHKSDNFIAEQLLLLAASTLSDTLNSSKVRTHILQNYLSDLKQIPRWVDGSGLSRYNLFSPNAMVNVLHKMYRETERSRLFQLFPAGGLEGTLKDRFTGTTAPYIYAKSGSLGNNYSLSGYLLTKKGKVLVFSYMNNHFTKSTAEIRKEMKVVLEAIRDAN